PGGWRRAGPADRGSSGTPTCATRAPRPRPARRWASPLSTGGAGSRRRVPRGSGPSAAPGRSPHTVLTCPSWYASLTGFQYHEPREPERSAMGCTEPIVLADGEGEAL